MNETIKQVLNQFGIDECLSIKEAPVHREKPYKVLMVGERYILKSSISDADAVEKIAQLNAMLFQEGAPVANFYKTKAGNFYAYADGFYFTLADKLPGTHFERVSKKAVYSLGKNLAKLHLALKKLEGRVDAYNMDTMGELRGWIIEEINKKQLPVKKEIIDYCMEFDNLYHRLPRQIIHRDPHGRNILMENDEITGFVDFDIIQINIRVLDMYYAFAPSEDKFKEWLELRPYFFSGYNEISAISKDELTGYTYMCVLFELLWLAYVSINFDEKVEDALKTVHWMYDVREEIKILGSHLTVPN